MRCGAGRLAPSGRGSRPERGVREHPELAGRSPIRFAPGMLRDCPAACPSVGPGLSQQLSHSRAFWEACTTQYLHASRVCRRPSPAFTPSRDAPRARETASRRDIPQEHWDGAGSMCGKVQALQPARCWASPPDTADPGEPVTQGRRLGVARRQARMLTRRRTTDSDHACLSGGTAGRWRGSVTPRRRTTSAARLSRLDRTKREPNPRDASQAPMSGAVIPARPRLVLTRPA